MKTTIILLFSICLIAINSGCDNEDGNGNSSIKYPKTATYGENLIQVNPLEIISSGNGMDTFFYYSLSAELSEGTSLKIIMKRKTTGEGNGNWFYLSGTGTGWSIDSYDTTNSTQQFSANGPSICDLKMFFTFTGSVDIEIYENGASNLTRKKTLNW